MSHIKSYTVVKGDNLTKIAKANDTTVSALLGANQDIKNPNLILVGQEIKIPEVETVDLNTSTEITISPSINENLRAQQETAKKVEAERRAAVESIEARSQQLKAERLKVQQETGKKVEAERRAAVESIQEKNRQLRAEQLKVQQETAKKVEAERKASAVHSNQTGQIKDEIQKTQLDAARQQEAERRQAGQVSEEAKKRMDAIIAKKEFERAEQEKLKQLNESQAAVREEARLAAERARKIPKIGEDGLVVLEKSEAGQKVINKLYYEIPSHKGGKHSAELDRMIDNLSPEECAWVLTRIEDKGFGQTGAGYAGKATPESHANFIQEQVIDRFGGDIHNLLKVWGTKSYSGY